VKTSGNLQYVALESGGYKVVVAWCVIAPKLLAGCAAQLEDGTAVLTQYGEILLFEGFRCDGGSGPAIDTPGGMEGWFAHDALYRMGRQGKLPPEWRKKADILMRKLHLLNGMPWLRAQWQYAAVRMFAGKHFEPQPSIEKQVRSA
jgi:hypothetical protein